MKSMRKRKSCMSSDISAGIKEKVTSHCPPDMTDSVKRALEAEIEAFKKDPENEAKARLDAEHSADGGPTLDAYQEWLAQNGGQETIEANPDIVAETDGLKYLPIIKDSKTASLLKEFRQSLTPRELQVWNLVMRHQFSHKKAAKLLNIPSRSIVVYLNRAKRKMMQFAEAIKRVEHETQG